jgi:hypothetical protein
VRLQKAGGLQLVERGQLDKILKELALAESGVVTETDAPRLGQLAGAQYVVLGRVARGVGASGYIASLRVVRAESGVVIGAGSAAGRDLEQIAARLAADALQTLRIYLALENPDSPYSVLIKLKGGQSGQPDGKNPRYQIGDRLSLEFKVLRHNAAAPARVYLQLYSIDAAGQLTLIYPNRFSPASGVETDRLYRLPAEHDDFEWHLAEPAGSESIQAIVTTRPVDFFQMGNRHTVETFPAVDARRFRDDLPTFRGIVTRIKKEKLKDWSAERVAYELVKP